MLSIIRELLGLALPAPLLAALDWLIWLTVQSYKLALYMFFPPFIEPGYQLLITIPIWVVWILVLTQPKEADKVIVQGCQGLTHLGNPMQDWFASLKHPVTSLIALVFAPQLTVFGVIFSRPWLSRLCLTVGTANILSSKLVGRKTIRELSGGSTSNWFTNLPIGWVLALASGLAILLLWFLFSQDDKYKKEVILTYSGFKAKHGAFLAFFFTVGYQLVRDFIPPSESWICTTCATKNPNKKTFCTTCRNRNPVAEWHCASGKCTHKNDGGTDLCDRCGEPNPHLEANPFNTTPPQSPPVNPTTPPPANSPPTSNPNHTATHVANVEMEKCPWCHQQTSKKRKFCINCGKSIHLKNDKLGSGVINFLDS